MLHNSKIIYILASSLKKKSKTDFMREFYDTYLDVFKQKV